MNFPQETLELFNNQYREVLARSISYHSEFNHDSDKIQIFFNLEEDRMNRVYDI